MIQADFKLKFNVPILYTAIHNGTHLRDELKDNLKIATDDRVREEDPYTDILIEDFDNTLVVHTSRFEIDLNRRRNWSVYQVPDDCWGLDVWQTPLTKKQVDYALMEYDVFYRRLDRVIQEMIATFGYALVIDVHSYNHHRLGIDKPCDPIEENPQIILGTNNMPRRYMPMVEQIKDSFLKHQYQGEQLDTRIDVKFPGGTMARHLHRCYPGKVFALAIEFKKTFMDEWSGELYQDSLISLKNILKSIEPLLLNDIKPFI